MNENQIASPVKEIPACWLDDKRMNVLFSPFRKRDLNPVDYDSKMKFWNNVIIQWCMENNKCVLTLDILRKTFKRKGRTPSCLVTVLQELVKTGDLKIKSDFLNMATGQTTWTSWAINSVKTPFIWSFTKLKDAITEIDTNEVQYVYIEYLKNKGEAIISLAQQTPEKCVYTIDEIREFIEPPECTTETVELLIHWLKLEGKACSTVCSNNELIKLAIAPGTVQITDKDVAQFKLAKSREVLENSIAYLEGEKEKALNDAKLHLSKGLRMAAKSSLRKKKALEECITKRISTLDNLELLSARIRDAQSDAEVYDSYKTGLSALKSTFQEAGLTEDNVADTIEEMERVTEMQEEIQNVLSQQMQPNTETELEEELVQILSSTKLGDELKLPDVPLTEVPGIKDVVNKKVEPIKFAVAE